MEIFYQGWLPITQSIYCAYIPKLLLFYLRINSLAPQSTSETWLDNFLLS